MTLGIYAHLFHLSGRFTALPVFFCSCGVWVLLCLVWVVWLCLFGLCGCCFCFVSLFFVARNNCVVASGWQPMLEIDKDTLVA